MIRILPNDSRVFLVEAHGHGGHWGLPSLNTLYSKFHRFHGARGVWRPCSVRWPCAVVADDQGARLVGRLLEQGVLLARRRSSLLIITASGGITVAVMGGWSWPANRRLSAPMRSMRSAWRSLSWSACSRRRRPRAAGERAGGPRSLGSSLAVRKRRTGGWGLVPQRGVDAAVAVAGVLGAAAGLCYCAGGSRSGRLCATWFWTDSMEWVSPSSTHSCRLSGVISSG